MEPLLIGEDRSGGGGRAGPIWPLTLPPNLLDSRRSLPEGVPLARLADLVACHELLLQQPDRRARYTSRRHRGARSKNDYSKDPRKRDLQLESESSYCRSNNGLTGVGIEGHPMSAGQ